jgi:ATP-dependent 26S proteasome regulatory subunit
MLFSQIKLGYPALWVKSIDSYSTIDTIVSFNLRSYFTMDPLKGFCEYKDKTWKPVLVDMPDPNDPEQLTKKVTFDFVVANEFLSTYETKMQKTFIFNIFAQAQEFLATYAGLFNSASMSYRQAFWSNDLDQMPNQYIIVSPSDCPEDYASLFKCLESDYPSGEEIMFILSHINNSSDNQLVKPESFKDIVNAGLGLSESEFINLSLQSVLENGEVNSEYIYAQKMSNIKKNGILEIIKPQVKFDNIGGLDAIKDLIIRNANLWHNPEQASKFGISPIRRMLMVGVPGTGKSAICEATANALGLDLARTGISQVMNSYIGQSEQNMRTVFKQINAMAPLCVWIDEFGRDLSGGSSSSHVDGGTTDRVHGEFLTGLQELPENVFLMCAANQLEHLKPEMLRADRFDKIMFVGLPSFEERRSIVSIYLSNIDTPHVYDLDVISNATQYFTGAEIKSLIKEVKFYVSSSELRAINTQDIVNYAPKMRNILWNKSRPMIQDLYKTAIDQWDWASTNQFNDAKMILSPNRINNSVSSPKIPVTNR